MRTIEYYIERYEWLRRETDEQIALHIQREKQLEARLDAIRVIVARWWDSEMSDDVALVAIKEVLDD